jgi:hypothetical protein
MSEETILFCLATFGAIAPPILVRGFRQNRSPKLDARQANSRPISSPWTGWCLKKSSADEWCTWAARLPQKGRLVIFTNALTSLVIEGRRRLPIFETRDVADLHEQESTVSQYPGELSGRDRCTHGSCPLQ